MSHRLTLSVMSFLWTYLACLGLLAEYQNSQPHTVILEVSQ